MRRHIVQTERGLNEMFAKLQRVGRSGTDSEFVPKKRYVGKHGLIGWSFAAHDDKGYEGWYVPLGHTDQEFVFNREIFTNGFPVNIPLGMFLEKAKPHFESGHIHVCHSAETESEALKAHGIEMRTWRDTMLESWMFDEERLYPYRLKEVVPKILGRKIQKIEEVVQKGRIKTTMLKGAEKSDLTRVPMDLAAVYAMDDSIHTLMLNEWFEPELRREETFESYLRIELPMVPIFRDMGRHGLTIDVGKCTKMRDALVKRLDVLEGDIYKESGEAFNIRSRQQLGRILFEKLRYPEMQVPDPADPEGVRMMPYRTETGQYKTSDDVMVWLAEQGYPVANLLREHGDLTKLRGTYFEPWLEEKDSDDRIHPSLWQCGTVTGRASGDMQQVPRKDKDFDIGKQHISCRDVVTVPEGSYLICADYSQIELRLLAHFSQDRALCGSFNAGEDLHEGTASEIRAVGSTFKRSKEVEAADLKKAIDFVRQDAKPVNFGLVYGLAQDTFIQMFGDKIGRAVFAALMARFEGALLYKSAAIHQAHLDGFIRTLAWRMRHLHDINVDSRVMRGYVERQAFNTLIQGSAADVLKMAMIRCRKELSDVPMILQVHDEILFECKGTKKHADEAAREIKRIMESVVKLSVPLIAEPNVGKTWLECK